MVNAGLRDKAAAAGRAILATKCWILSRVENRGFVGSDFPILWAIVQHVGEGITFAATACANGTIGMAALLSLSFGFRPLAAAILLVASVLAVFGQWYSGLPGVFRFWLLLPQLTLLIVTALGAIVAILQSHYADGILRPWAFILWDQSPRLGMPFIYATAIYARVRLP